MSNDNNDLFNRSKWRIKSEIDAISSDEQARKRKERLDELQFERALRKELEGLEGLLP
jgi:hypothetical protein